MVKKKRERERRQGRSAVELDGQEKGRRTDGERGQRFFLKAEEISKREETPFGEIRPAV